MTPFISMSPKIDDDRALGCDWCKC